MRYEKQIHLNGREISLNSPVYFVADVASNHDGDLQRAIDLIYLAKEAGADAVKFQHFIAEKIVSDVGFKELGGQFSHQAKWGKPVFEVYKQYECNRDWSMKLIEVAQKAGIDFMTTPYDFDAVDLLDKYLPAYKIGSGDITWLDFLRRVANCGKPVFLATGASDMLEVEKAVDSILENNREIVLMQCNTNYTGSVENYQYINLNVLKSYAAKYPDMLLGLSDHTPGYVTVLGAVTLGARVIEKHFTDDNNRVGPDHAFSMDPSTWKAMVEQVRVLEMSLGDGVKRVEGNELDTVVLQRRCLRTRRAIKAGHLLQEDDLEVLRPAPVGSLQPYWASKIVGKNIISDKEAGEAFYQGDIEGLKAC